MKVTITFPTKAKKKVLTQRGMLRPEVSRDIGLLLDGYYKSFPSSSYRSVIEDPKIPLKIEVIDD